MDGLCLCITVVRISVFRQCNNPFLAASCRGGSGSCAFLVLYLVTPDAFHSLMGPLGGLCLGFCVDYRYKTAMNCFGALMLATGIYGLQGAVILRIVDTLLGVTFGLILAVVFHRLAAVRLMQKCSGER